MRIPVARRADLEKALAELEYAPQPFDVAMLSTGAAPRRWTRAVAVFEDEPTEQLTEAAA